MASPKENRIEALQIRRDQLDAEIARLRARSRSEEQKALTRRKILIGAVVMNEMQLNPAVDQKIRRLLGEKLTRNRDRVLFGLPVLEEPIPKGSSITERK